MIKRYTVLAFAGLMAMSSWSVAGSEPNAVVVVALDELPGVDRLAEAMITKFEYQPAKIGVKAGTTVVWTNGDRFDHDVLVVGRKSPAGEDTRSELVNLNGKIAMTFNEPGTYVYICSVHPFMQGEIVVEPATSPSE